MAVTDQERRINREAVYRDVLAILEMINEDWDVGEINAETRLGSVVPESISLVYLIGDLQHQYHLQDLLVQKLRAADSTLTELRVADMVDLVCEILKDRAIAQDVKND